MINTIVFQKSSTDAVTEELLDSSVPTTQQTKTKTRRKAKPKSKVVSSPKAEAPSVSSAIDLAQKQTSPTSVTSNPHKQRVIKQLYPPTGKSVLVVESVTKAKVIQGYLGDMFEVIPSYGHVRDLAARSGSVRPGEDFSMVWEVPSAAWTHLKSIKVALSGYGISLFSCSPYLIICAIELCRGRWWSYIRASGECIPHQGKKIIIQEYFKFNI